MAEGCSLHVFQQCAARSGASQVKVIKHLKERRPEHTEKFTAPNSANKLDLHSDTPMSSSKSKIYGLYLLIGGDMHCG